MCVVSKEGKYEVIVCDKKDDPIISFDANSISSICRLIDDSNLDKCNFKIIRKEDFMIFDTDFIMEIWRSK